MEPSNEIKTTTTTTNKRKIKGGQQKVREKQAKLMAAAASTSKKIPDMFNVQNSSASTTSVVQNTLAQESEADLEGMLVESDAMLVDPVPD